VYEENQRFPTEKKREIAKKYQAVVGIGHLAADFDKHYLKYLRMGYFEPIPLAWATSNYNPLTEKMPGSQYDDGAGMQRPQAVWHYLTIDRPEERLYWVLNHCYHVGKPRQPIMRPSESAEVSAIRFAVRFF
jgi:hypothetical protein